MSKSSHGLRVNLAIRALARSAGVSRSHDCRQGRDFRESVRCAHLRDPALAWLERNSLPARQPAGGRGEDDVGALGSRCRTRYPLAVASACQVTSPFEYGTGDRRLNSA